MDVSGELQTGPKGAVRIVGQGYVGLPLAVLAAEKGYDVTGVDVDAARVERLTRGWSAVEDVPDPRLREVLASGRYRAVTACAPYDGDEGFHVAVLSVPTPLHGGRPDLSCVEAAAASVAPAITPGCTVVLESTTYPGTTEELVAPILEAGSGLLAGRDFFLGYSPERIDPGNPDWPLEAIPKIVSGVDDASLAAVRRFYDSLGIRTVAARGTREAELAKLLENTFRHVNIALVNELAMWSHGLGIDVWDAVRTAGTKPFGFMTFTPGPGVGGHCLPVDPSYLAWRIEDVLGHPFRFVELANEVNRHMPDYVVRRVGEGLTRRGLALADARVLVLGLAYKPGTADTRESPCYRVCELLLDAGARVSVADPRAPSERTPPGVGRVAGGPPDVAEADAVVLLTDHAEFDLAGLGAASAFVLDCRGVTTSPAVERL